jgi:hypothetical protein
MVSVFGWIVWCVDAAFALSWTYGLRTYTKNWLPVPIATAVQAFFFSAIAVVFLFVGHSKLHILWIAPVCFVASFFLTMGNIPILSPVVKWFTGLFVEIVLIGLKRPNEGAP